jgi:outer membrane protein W
MPFEGRLRHAVVLRARARLLLGGLMLLSTTSVAAAQEPGSFMLGAGVGITIYCIDTRCNDGTMLGVASGFQFTHSLGVEVSVRWHECFDCDQFRIGDAAVLAQYPRGRVRPYVGAGVGYSSDPGFMGSHFGALAAVGARIPLRDHFLVGADVRGRRLGSSGSMGDFTLWIHYRTSPR